MTDRHPGLSSKLESLASEIRMLDLDLKSQPPPDGAVLQEFRRALDNIRLTAWTVSELINARETGKNPHTVLSFLTAERLRRFTQIARELATEIERGGLSWQTDGVRALTEAVLLLQTQTSRLAHDHRSRFRTAGDHGQADD